MNRALFRMKHSDICRWWSCFFNLKSLYIHTSSKVVGPPRDVWSDSQYAQTTGHTMKSCNPCHSSVQLSEASALHKQNSFSRSLIIFKSCKVGTTFRCQHSAVSPTKICRPCLFCGAQWCQIHKSTLPGATFKAGHVDMFRPMFDHFASRSIQCSECGYEQKISGKACWLTNQFDCLVPTAANCQMQWFADVSLWKVVTPGCI